MASEHPHVANQHVGPVLQVRSLPSRYLKLGARYWRGRPAGGCVLSEVDSPGCAPPECALSEVTPGSLLLIIRVIRSHLRARRQVQSAAYGWRRGQVELPASEPTDRGGSTCYGRFPPYPVCTRIAAPDSTVTSTPSCPPLVRRCPRPRDGPNGSEDRLQRRA